MGGNALKELKPKRMTSKEVIDTFHYIQRLWSLEHVGPPLYLVPWVEEKDDHGDIDIVVEASIESVKAFLDAHVEIQKRNDKVISAGWKVDQHIVQVDFICADPVDAAATRFFYSGGDFGMLLGRLAAWHGLVFGMDGLRLRADHTKPWSKDIFLTARPDRILDTLGLFGYPPRFKTYESMWKYVTSSKKARPYMFMPEATNAENRSRDKQRPKIKEFQAWLSRWFTRLPGDPQDLPRVSFDAALHQAHLEFGQRVMQERHAQQDTWEHERAFVKSIGIDAVCGVVDADIDMETAGKIIRSMQQYLPREWLQQHAREFPELAADIARNAARLCLLQAGYPVKPVLAG